MDTYAAGVWNKLLREYSQYSLHDEVFKLYKQIQSAHNSVLANTRSSTTILLLKICSNLRESVIGAQLHGYIIKVGFNFHVHVQTTLLNMYLVRGLFLEAISVFMTMGELNQVTWNVMLTGFIRCGKLSHAIMISEYMPHLNVVSWTGLIDGFTRANRPKDALILFIKMLAMRDKPNEITILTVAPSVSILGNFDIGRSIHAYTEKNSYYAADIRVSNSFIDMYGKCGSVEFALQVFEDTSVRRNLISWTTVLSVLAIHGMAREALHGFEIMTAINLKPNSVTYLNILHACSHGGLVDEGMKLFHNMLDYHIVPEIKHYGCVIDLLCRSGLLEEAEKLVMDAPMKDSVILWRTLLGSCTFHGNSEIGERAMGKILELEREYGGDYTLMYNLFAASGRFHDAKEVRKCMNASHMVKAPAFSLFCGS